MLHKSKVSAKDKVKTIRKCLTGKIGQRAAARELEVNLASIQRWIKQYEAEGKKHFCHMRKIAETPAIYGGDGV